MVDAYAATLDIDLAYQNFDDERRTLANMYGEQGGFWLAYIAGEAVGCVALRRLDDHVAELKRLYVLPSGRGHGLGRKLTQTALACARELGYHAVRLDTLEDMAAARALYRELGFIEIEPYYDSPVPGTSFLEYRF